MIDSFFVLSFSASLTCHIQSRVFIVGTHIALLEAAYEVNFYMVERGASDSTKKEK